MSKSYVAKNENQDKFKLTMHIVAKWYHNLEQTYNGILRCFVINQFVGFFFLIFSFSSEFRLLFLSGRIKDLDVVGPW